MRAAIPLLACLALASAAAAIDSPAEPAVWEMLFSRIVASFTPNREARRNRITEITATGIDALTVSPTLSTRYREEAPKMAPSTVPRMSARGVNSASRVSGAM